MKELSVAIVDDNPMVLDKLDEILGQEEGLNVVGRAEDGEEAIHLIAQKRPDVVLLDLIMPKIVLCLQISLHLNVKYII